MDGGGGGVIGGGGAAAAAAAAAAADGGIGGAGVSSGSVSDGSIITSRTNDSSPTASVMLAAVRVTIVSLWRSTVTIWPSRLAPLIT